MTPILEMVLRSSLVLLIGFAVLSLLRKQPSALRHWVLLAALSLAAAQPALNWVVPAWTISNAAWAERPVASAATVQTEESFGLPDTPPIQAAPGVDWRAIAFRVWIAGVIAGLAVLLVGALWLMWLTSKGAAADARWQSAADDVRRRLGMRRPIRVVITDHPAMLVTWGVIAPVILLPKSALGWPADRVQLVLSHEIAHLVRHDWLVQLGAEMLRAINWFNPLFWVACARLRRESEYACDDVVLELGTAGTTYAGHLVELARSFSAHGRTWLPAPSIARPSTLERRVRAMLNPQLDRRPVTNRHKSAFALLLLAMALPIAAAAGRSMPSGVVRDPSGRVLPAASVRLSAIGRDAIHETQSDATGSFQFPDIPDGDYMLSARVPGFQSTRQRVRLSPNSTPFELSMQVGTLRETVTVNSGDGSKPSVTTARTTPSAPACGSTELGGNLKPPMKLRDVRPRYKSQWLETNLQGSVLLQASIGVDGRVRNVEVVSPVNADLEEEAVAAVMQWEFSPTYLNCEAIEVRMFVTVSFKTEA